MGIIEKAVFGTVDRGVFRADISQGRMEVMSSSSKCYMEATNYTRTVICRARGARLTSFSTIPYVDSFDEPAELSLINLLV